MATPLSRKRLLIQTILVLAGVGLLCWLWTLQQHWGEAMDRRLAKGQRLKSIDLGLRWGWELGMISSLLLVVLGLTGRWWIRRLSRELWADQTPRPGKIFLIGLGLCVILAGVVRLPRMELSLYNDEAYSFRRHIAGEYKTNSKTGEWSWRQAPWSETFWKNEIGNNGSLFSMTARLSYEAWKRSAGAVDGEVREWPLRLPSMIGGLLAVAFVGLLARDLAGRRAGWMAAIVSAVHPWQIRYSTEARPHGLAMGLGALLLWLLWRAIRSGGWGWWIGFAVTEAVLLGTYPGAVPFLVAVNGAAAVLLFSDAKRRSLVLRFAIANIVAAMLWLPFFYALVPQAETAIKSVETMQGGATEEWWQEVGALSSVGAHYRGEVPDNPLNPALVGDGLQILPQTLAWIGTAIVLLALVLAALQLRRRGGWISLGTWFAIAFGGTLLAFVLSEWRNTVLHPWYGVVGLSGFTLLVGIGIGSLRRRWLSWGLLALYVAAVIPIAAGYLRSSKQQLREVVTEARGAVYPAYQNLEKDTRFAGFWSSAGVYDPYLKQIFGVDDLRVQEDAAASAGETLYVVFGYETLARQHAGGLVDRVTNPVRYDEVARLPGLTEAQFTERVFRWRGDDKNAKP